MPEETKELLRQLHADNVTLRDEELPALRQALAQESVDREADLRKERGSRRRFLAAFIVAVMVGSFVVARIGDWVVCTTSRSNALSGPGNDRVDLFLQAYNEAAGAVHTPLTGQQRAEIIAGLDNARKQFTVIPDHGKLLGQPDPELLGLRDLIASLRANVRYQTASADHPVCSLWSL